MHGQEESSRIPRATWVVLHLVELGVALWILLGDGYATVGRLVGREWTPGDPDRRMLLALFAVVLFLRMTATGLYLLRRRFGWSEAVPVTLASGLYQLGFALLGAGAAARLGALDGLAVVLYATGSVFNTGSELQRLAFKKKPENAGKIFTRGFFALCRHPNYFGDSLWGTAWALATRNPWSAIIVVLEVSGFVFSQIPMLDRYLDSHYGDAYREWAQRTKRFVPFVY